VYDPLRDEMFAAAVDEPAYLNNRPITVLATPLGPEFWEQAWVGTDLPHAGPMRDAALQIFQLLSGQVLTQVVLGSPALGLSYVAAGRLHAYWNLDAKPWDVAAACVILQQAGAIISDADGGAWIHSDGSYVAATPASHQWAMRGIKLVRDRARSLGLV
jgi:myo-inositol-1(or 4)-monophosphatase